MLILEFPIKKKKLSTGFLWHDYVKNAGAWGDIKKKSLEAFKSWAPIIFLTSRQM